MSSSQPQKVLSVLDIVSLIVGTVVGAGLFKTPALVAGALGTSTEVMLAWVAGGVASFIGALCYAELATSYPHVGGEYHFLHQAYGRSISFLFAWSRATVIVTGSIAGLAIAMGDYLAPLFPTLPNASMIFALMAILLLSGLNALGVYFAKSIQNFFLWIELAAVVTLLIAGFLAHPVVEVGVPPPSGSLWSGLGFAMIFVLLTYGGWNEAAYLSAEARDDRRGVVWGLLLGLGVVTVLYVCVNCAYLWGLGLAGVAASSAPAASLFQMAFGERASIWLSVIIAFSCMKSVNATIFLGSRSNFAVGQDWRLFGWLGHWHEVGAPRRALFIQAIIACLLVAFAAWTRHGFQAVVEFTAPVFWLFIVLTALSLIVLRRRGGAREGAFKVPLYPLTPILFVLLSGWLLYSSVSYTGVGALVGVVFLALGVIPLVIERQWLKP
jgi:amino acid transporter